jgi:type II secretory pathway pseudopilin PulG
MKTRTARRGEQGFSVLQLMIVFTVVAVVAGIGLPVYASRARDVVLEQNVGNLELQVKGMLAVDEDAQAGDDALSARLAHALRGGETGRYANPLSGSDAVVCQTSMPAAGSPAPGVWITDDARYAHEDFVASSATRSRLAGTLLVVFMSDEGERSSVDVFYVDSRGRRSNLVGTLAPLGG